ncbi:hypothetical protein KJI95_16330 [Shewanella sp. JM162201]|uniref:Uncharacterized protein n=1 Tax=Shewanella jiangmenensis TaxID=2837387 RepID=A0ABS5V6I7_9GAMM|nr:hypothetical protein [Shewanella jiangmenensis]MBT1446064.1 hypothetical protein [Shewanella jiangmenensis]
MWMKLKPQIINAKNHCSLSTPPNPALKFPSVNANLSINLNANATFYSENLQNLKYQILNKAHNALLRGWRQAPVPRSQPWLAE